MKEVSTEAAEQSRKISEQKLTVALDLAIARSGCARDEAGGVLLEQRLSTTAKAMSEVFALETWKRGCIRPG